jgi:hypothetical protein
MENAEGTQLFKVWGGMNDSIRLCLIERLTKLENQLASIEFPAYGGLYLRDSISDDVKAQHLNATIDPSASYCIGPLCEQSWLLNPNMKTSGGELDIGPCKCCASTSLYPFSNAFQH